MRFEASTRMLHVTRFDRHSKRSPRRVQYGARSFIFPARSRRNESSSIGTCHVITTCSSSFRRTRASNFFPIRVNSVSPFRTLGGGFDLSPWRLSFVLLVSNPLFLNSSIFFSILSHSHLVNFYSHYMLQLLYI